jgi:short subunit dehydrogenase-like uncharacterized protein
MRRNGKIVTVPLGSKTRRIDFGNGEKLAVMIPWGDVSTAYYTTGIGNIEVFTATSQNGVKRLRRAEWLRPVMRQRWIQRIIQHRIDRRVVPPDQTQRESNPSYVWGEVRNAAGQVRTARLKTPNGYALTVHSAIGIVERLLSQPNRAGFMTPSMLVGAEFVSTLPNCSAIRIEP